MIDHDIIFDKTNQKIAIINSDCEQIEMNDDKKNSEGHSNENGKINNETNKQNNNETNKNNTESNILSSDIIDKNENNNSFNKYESNINKSEYTENISSSSNNNNASISSTIILEKNNSTLNNTNDTNTEISDISSSIINNTIISNVSNTSMNIIDTTSSNNIKNNSNMNNIINSIIKYTNESQSDSYIKDTIFDKNEIKIAKTSYIISSILINNKIISKTNIEKTTEKIEDNKNKNLNSTSIKTIINLITDKIEISKNNKKSEDKWDFEDISDDKKQTKNKNDNDNDKYKRGENAYLRDKSFSNTIFRMLKSFIRNKLIYFLLALIGLIGSFFLIILISCAIISCVRIVKRKNYMEQIDDEVPKYSKYNSASLSSRSN
jgi:hypothetical protein